MEDPYPPASQIFDALICQVTFSSEKNLLWLVGSLNDQLARNGDSLVAIETEFFPESLLGFTHVRVYISLSIPSTSGGKQASFKHICLIRFVPSVVAASLHSSELESLYLFNERYISHPKLDILESRERRIALLEHFLTIPFPSSPTASSPSSASREGDFDFDAAVKHFLSDAEVDWTLLRTFCLILQHLQGFEMLESLEMKLQEALIVQGETSFVKAQIAFSFRRVANVQFKSGQSEDAKSLCAQALQLYREAKQQERDEEKTEGKAKKTSSQGDLIDDAETVAFLLLQSEMAQTLGQLFEALTLCSEALGVQRRVFGAESREVVGTLQRLAALEEARGALEEAQKLHSLSLQIAREREGEHGWQV